MRAPAEPRGDCLGRLGVGQPVVEDLDLDQRPADEMRASRRRTVSTSGSSGISRSSRAAAAGARRDRRRSRTRRAPRPRPRSASAASRACTCASGSPAADLSPGLACTTTPTAWSIGSSLRSRPAPSRIAARPIASAPQRATEPARGAGTATHDRRRLEHVPRPLGADAASPPWASTSRSSARTAAPEVIALPRPGGGPRPRRRPGRRAPPCARPSPARARGSRPARAAASISHASATSSALPTAAPSGASIARQLADRRPAGAHADAAHQRAPARAPSRGRA